MCNNNTSAAVAAVHIRWNYYYCLQFVYAVAMDLLTVCAHRGKYHVDPTNRCVTNTPFTTLRSITSIPTTAGFIGLGYFLHAACATVSHGWLKIDEKKNNFISFILFISIGGSFDHKHLHVTHFCRC